MPITPSDNALTWKPRKETLHRPLYLSLADALERDILSGNLIPGTKLPTQRALADYLDINFTTVTRAYKICTDKGLISGVTGNGTFVSSHTRSVADASDRSREDAIDLSFVSTFEQTNTLVTDSIRKMSQKIYLEQLLDYTNPSGMPHHKKAGLDWLTSFGISASPEQIAIATGTHNAVTIALTSLFKPGSAIAVNRYVYASFIELARIFHIELVPLDGDDQGMLPEELEKCCRLKAVQGVLLMPSCDNPTTTVISENRKKELAAVIRKCQLTLIENDMYAFLNTGMTGDKKEPMFNLLPENTVYISGASQSLCSGLRVSYMVFGKKFRERVLNALYNINVKTSSLDAEVVTELIVSGTARHIVAQKTQLARQANGLFYECFPEASRTGHPLSFFRWLPIPSAQNAFHVESLLQRHGIIVSHSDRFTPGHGQPDSYLRVSLASARTFDRLRTGLNILKNQLKELTISF